MLKKLALMLVGCAVLITVPIPLSAQSDHSGYTIRRALVHPARPEDDKAVDPFRRPLDVLLFAGLEPGMHVLDVNSGSGYYTEIMARVVGPDGRVYAHNGAVNWSFVKDAAERRYRGPLLNVTPIHNGREEVDLPEASVDMLMIALAYHDYWFKHAARKEAEDIPAILASFHKALKPGGTLLVIDHVGKPRSTAEDINQYHRVDPQMVRGQLEAAGFIFAAKSDLLANPEDNPLSSPYDPARYGRTNRFIFKFTK
ncbi:MULTISPECIES: class I SAM-dependent methyltransferase [Kordiimonas]|jgi:predicted methyltransferase|uniref:class I SAM-dependent methyltransferase n=1 Tax=Kordiimonas TaxID=288021 RepID=UPI00257D417A|nr:methyltransferase domain-containing protein [Kordiimonas sp. UBA4487]